MNVWAKMLTALRGGVNEAGEAIVDSQALRILDQEVRDASEELKRSKDSLAEIIARQKLSEEKVSQMQQKVGEYEGYAIKAMEQSDDKLAHEVASKIAELENQLKIEQEAGTGYASSAATLRNAIHQAEGNIRRMKQQVDTVKATESVQRAQMAVAERHSGSNTKLRTAMDSLERIKERQALNGAQMAAASELAEETSDVSLQSKLEAAGISASSKSADDILARLREKASS